MVGLALVPLAAHQGSNATTDIGSNPLATRVAQIPKNFLVGFNLPAEVPVSVGAFCLVLLALWLLFSRAAARDRQPALLALGIATIVVLVPILMAATPLDLATTRSVTPALIPAIVAIAVGFASERIGLYAAAALCALSLFAVTAVAADKRFQRLDWRGAARALGSNHTARALVVSPPLPPGPLGVYFPRLRPIPRTGSSVREVDLVGLAYLGRYGAGLPHPPAPVAKPLAGFERRPSLTTREYTIVRFRARRPRLVTREVLRTRGLISSPPPAIEVQGAR